MSSSHIKSSHSTNNKDRFNISIIGVGLIGGSLALSLKGFKNAFITGMDIDSSSLEKALKCGAIDAATEDAKEAIENADLVILCVSPNNILNIIKEHKNNFKKGCILTDVCGTKHNLYKEIEQIVSPDIKYIGIHPMAGKEVGGFDNACTDLFIGTGFIIIPLDKSETDATLLMKQMAEYIGAKHIAVTDAETHDDIIAYTSDLMHISAGALCIDYHPEMTKAYTAGAFRDCTRIANMDAGLWTELLICNNEKIIDHLDNYIKNLVKIRDAMANYDNDTLHDLLAQASTNKKEMLKR